jgi:hypothetical protein
MPTATLLSALCAAGVLERTPARGGTYLRVSPRFLAHAEASSSRLRVQGLPATPGASLSTALTSWDGFTQDPLAAADLLLEILEARNQLGGLRPVFPMLEQFAPIAA